MMRTQTLTEQVLHEVKIGKRKLRMSSGEIRTFKSGAHRARFERVAQAIKRGWRPTRKWRKK